MDQVSCFNNTFHIYHTNVYNTPGTKLEKRLARGDVGINPLDEACREHDISYSQEKNTKLRHVADERLAKRAMERTISKDASLQERLMAFAVGNAMKAKVKLGMGLSKDYLEIINTCVKLLERIKISSEKTVKEVNDCINILNKKNVKQTTTKPKKRRNNTAKRNKAGEEKMNWEDDINTDNDNLTGNRKRKKYNIKHEGDEGDMDLPRKRRKKYYPKTNLNLYTQNNENENMVSSPATFSLKRQNSDGDEVTSNKKFKISTQKRKFDDDDNDWDENVKRVKL